MLLAAASLRRIDPETSDRQAAEALSGEQATIARWMSWFDREPGIYRVLGPGLKFLSKKP